jgi:ribosomal protein S18 acetylase RimI-like enzyme
MQQPACIRTATLKDFERIVELEGMCFPKELTYSRRQLRYLLTKANSTVLVWTENLLIRGFLIVLYRKGATVAGIETINVDPLFRNKGIGLRLLTSAEQLLIKKGIRKIRLEVAITNQAAIKLYEHVGFQKTRLLRHYYYYDHDGSRDAYRMVKELG